MVADVEPITHVEAVTINRNGFSREGALDDDGNELFGKLKRAVVVRTIRDNRRHAVGVMIGTHEHVTGGFARGIWRIGSVRRRLGKKSGWPERAEYFVSGDVMETMIAAVPTGAAGF